MKQPLIPVSVGELLDKITILEIKSERISDARKLGNVRHELARLNEVWTQVIKAADSNVDEPRERLKRVNEALWEIEDRIRIKEAQRSFDDEFVELARAVYRTNDERAAIKLEVNIALDSELIEEKSYQDYQ